MKFTDGILVTEDNFKFDLKQAFIESWYGNDAFQHSFEPGDCGGFSLWFPGQYIAVEAERDYRKEKGIKVNVPSPPEWQKQFREIGKYVEKNFGKWVK